MSEKTLNITVNIADRPYNMKVTKEEEVIVRSAAKAVNEKLREYKQFAVKDKSDLLAMSALSFAIDSFTKNNNHSEFEVGTIHKLNEIDKKFTEYLESTV